KEYSTPVAALNVTVTDVASHAGAGTESAGADGVTGAAATVNGELITQLVPTVLAYTVPLLLTGALKLPPVIKVVNVLLKEYSTPVAALNVTVTD
ncbi:hypothetical protein, partial [Christiangramia aquimixticola]|uniref:hypothetical protein n=1 Tax=Christiangramia aquimixticola TaxID=1697558 RepID=UPI003AA7C60E